MTTTIQPTSDQIPAQAHAANQHHNITLSDVAGKVSFGRVVKGEWIKLLSLRSIRWTIVISIVLGAALSALLTFGFTQGQQPMAPLEYAIIPASVAVQFGVLLFGVLGVLTITNEYSSGMILSSLTAVPKRGLLFWGKFTAVALITIALSFVLEVLALVISGIFEPEVFSLLGDPAVLTAALGVVISLTFICLFAFGLGSLMRSAAGAISTVLAVVFVVPVVLSFMMSTGWEWVDTVSLYVPNQLSQTLTMGTEFAMVDPGYWGSLGVLAAWVALTVIPAAILFARRDAK